MNTLIALILLSVSSLSATEKGSLRVDGSSTVFPITAAVAEEFNKVKEFRDIRTTVAYSGTGGGFKKWCLGETDINDASRPITEKEIECTKERGIQYLEIPVAFDGITVVSSHKNTFVKSLSLADLKKIWGPSSTVKKWSDVNPKWPAENIKLFGPGTDSGTFDYFTETVSGKARASRSDYTASEDDNVLVRGVESSPYTQGYFGFSYYRENQKLLKAIPLDGGKGPVSPSDETIANATYPLSRKVFLYVSSKSGAKPEVQQFIRFYLKKAGEIVKQVGYTPLPQKDYDKAGRDFDKFVLKAQTPGKG